MNGVCLAKRPVNQRSSRACSHVSSERRAHADPLEGIGRDSYCRRLALPSARYLLSVCPGICCRWFSGGCLKQQGCPNLCISEISGWLPCVCVCVCQELHTELERFGRQQWTPPPPNRCLFTQSSVFFMMPIRNPHTGFIYESQPPYLQIIFLRKK